MAYDHPPASHRPAGPAPKRPVSVVIGGSFCVLTCAAWTVLVVTCLVRAATDAGYGLLFAVGVLALPVAVMALPADRTLPRFLGALGRASEGGRRLAILILIAPMAVLAFVFGIDPGRLFAGVLWLVAALPCLVFAFLAGRAATARGRADLGSGRMVAGPGIFAGVISTFFVLGVVFGDDPWTNWMPVGFVLAALGIVADAFWSFPAAGAYLQARTPARSE
ncbi:hypothetical protein [Actinomadura rugatobispora]|uniref:Integral membrane protein n=1 Tax=Actinomadura rugatobispora TaxID=1994 RepID=A0ABW0ZZ73_9ACTN|nr:hypothetical protein GCM10010200_007760 [Actinomadura rugatobispora]